jgi:hypothetical protein
MATSRIKTSSILQGFPKSRSLLAGNAAYIPSDYESISTVIVGSGGASSITFSSIPQGYAHLQVRGIARANRATYGADTIRFTVNSDTGANYAFHNLRGDGSSAAAGADPNSSYIRFLDSVGTNNGPGAGNVGVSVCDILDYADTNKFKTIRVLSGVDTNGTVAGFGGVVGITSGLWRSTSAITSITLVVETGINFLQYSKFALYGIRD